MPATALQPCYLLFGARIQQLREALGITQDELRKKVGLTRTSISNIEAGRQRVLLHDVDIFAKAFGITPKNLMKGIWL
jgi:transcriptional regulator with XRE-family HTH domain